MKQNWIDNAAVVMFIAFAAIYLLFATYVCNDLTRNAFDVIQGAHVYDVDDTYRLFLARDPFVASGLWLWNFILPVNIVFDGFFSWLTGHDVYLMRVSHIIAVLGSLYLVYRAGRHLHISAACMLLSCCVLLVMPLYMLVAMSFYGESLLAAAMGLVIYAIAARKEKLLMFFLSLFPLIRPEGFFFLAMMAVQRLLEKRPVSVFLIALPGFIYFCCVMYSFDFSIETYFGWRNVLSSHYPLIPPEESVMGHPLMPYYTVNPVWWILGFAGAFLPSLRRFRPLFIAAALLVLYWGWQSLNMQARGEARYFYAVFPLLTLSLAALVDVLGQEFRKNTGKAGMAALLISLVFTFIVLENLAQIDPVRASLFKDRRWPLAGEKGAKSYFGILPPELIEARRTTASFLAAYTQHDKSIRKIIVHAFPVFNDIDPGQLPPGVEIEYAPMTPKATYRYYGGYFYSMFPQLPQFTFYRFSPAEGATPNDGKRYALYVGPLYNGIHEPLYANPYFQVYKVNYESRQDLPETVLNKSLQRSGPVVP